MKTLYYFTCLIIISLPAQAQKQAPDVLPYIDSYPIKIDGGCSFFNNISTPLNEDKYQLIISARKEAFIEYRPLKFFYFNRTGRVKTRKGYIDYYKGKNGTIVLTIDSILKTGAEGSVRKGLLNINAGGIVATFKVHGMVDEFDIYNGHTEKQIHHRR